MKTLSCFVPASLGTMLGMPDKMAIIHSMCRAAVQTDDVGEFLDLLNQAAMDAVAADRAFIAIANNDTGELRLVSTAGTGWNDEFRALRLKIGEHVPPAGGAARNTVDQSLHRSGITSHVAASGKPYSTPDVSADPYYFAFFDDVVSE